MLYLSHISMSGGQTYTVTVGAGGSAATSYSANGGNGHNSAFDVFTVWRFQVFARLQSLYALTKTAGIDNDCLCKAIGGGGGMDAHAMVTSASTGGSGGGGGQDSDTHVTAPGSGTAGQGYSGGSAQTRWAGGGKRH